MRIKSPFRDYYDGLAANDLEPEPLYVRKTESCNGNKHNVPSLQLYGRYGTKVLSTNVIGFAGRLYPVIKHITPPIYCGQTNSYQSKETHSFYYTAAAYMASIEKNLDKFDIAKIEAFFNLQHISWSGERTLVSGPLLDYFSTYKTPIFIASGDKHGDNIVRNARLASWDFARIVPPYQAWRDLTVYLSNLANPNPTIPTISNADMIVAKGFNHPDSFRNVKGESGPARKRKKK